MEKLIEEDGILMTEEWWSQEKEELITSIETAMEKEVANKDVLEIMIELVKNTRVRVSMAEYFEEEGGD
jgi:predicted transcriptional regulator